MEAKIAMIDLKDGHSLSLKFNLPDEIDMDKLLRIDIANIAAEIVTIPVTINTMGLLLADATSAFNIAKLNLSIYEAEKREKIRDAAIKKPSLQEVDDQLTLDKTFQVKKKVMYKCQKDMEYINSLYWSLKSKDDKINKLSAGISSGDINEQLINTKLRNINLVDMRVVRPLIQ